MSTVVLGVGGGIAAYKSAELLRLFTESGHDVRVVPTAASLEFVGAATWEALSGQKVATGVFSDVHEVPHVRIGQSADLVVVAPATADLLARAAHGLADDLLTSTLLTARCPVVLVPAMHTEMWEHAATRANVALLRERGVTVVEPDVGRLTGADSGKGRLPAPERVFALASDLLARGTVAPDLVGVRVLVSCGGTREHLDPVRYLGNRSSGRQGVALAEAAVARGASVHLVAAHVSVPLPAGVDVTRVESTRDLHEAMLRLAPEADAVVMAAAPADFRPASQVPTKIKKEPGGAPPVVELVENPDVLAALVQARVDRRASEPDAGPVLVGFAAETGDARGSVLEHARRKLERKGCDLLVLNDVGEGRAFDRPDNEATILAPDGSATPVPHGSKLSVAHAVWDQVARRLGRVGD
ncbi:bifunctional phosphopantothenoylcysteine decarboxylase/phosphopantothenate--cysteine ligase CoaBC [Solicola sp. PLA-1-18]|uniref:bifunctional phosphopantothenoylcysteine decarboxylase/phosphopantothenate--cysteine ligase CoaBC n=1 Tax=Solicola sp. PLA-1-18 TaxID=3380532 RepID=UPI003B7F1DE3